MRFFSKLLILAALLLLSVNAVLAQTADCAEGTTEFPNLIGSVCLPVDGATRVVALEWTFVEYLLALGIQPVGVADIQGYHDWVNIPLELDESVVDVGARNAPNLEVIAGLEPDLIIGVSFRMGESFDDLSAIAPTIVYEFYPTDGTTQYEAMIDSFRSVADAVNHEAEAEAVLAKTNAFYVLAQNALEDAGRADETFIMSQGWTVENVATFRLFTDNAMAVQILNRIGLENAWDDEPQVFGFTEIGIEGFADLQDGDFNFFYVAQEADNDIFAESPLWGSMTFVQDDRAYWLGGDVWFFGGPLSAEVVVETVLTAMGVDLPAAEATAEPSA